MNTREYKNRKEKDVSKVPEDAKDQTTFLFTAVDRVAAPMHGDKRLRILLRGNVIL